MPTIDEVERMMNLFLILADVADADNLSPSAFRKMVDSWLLHEFPHIRYLASTVYDELYKTKQSPRWFAQLEVTRGSNGFGELLGLDCPAPRVEMLVFYDGRLV